MNNKVSICVPTYIQVEFLRKTLQSISGQTFSDFELIISDDSPGDSVKKLLSQFDFNRKLVYFQNKPSLGTPANWNYAQEKASGKYIKMLHHDDFFTSPDSLTKYVKLLDDYPESDFGFSATEVWSLATNTKHKHICSAEKFKEIIKNPELLFFGNWIGSPSATIYKKSASAVYDHDMKWLVDIDYYIQRIKENPKISFSREALICTVDGAKGQVTEAVINDKEIQIKEHLYLFNKIFKSGISVREYSGYFNNLFERFDISSMEDLDKIYKVTNNLRPFLFEVFTLQRKIKPWRKIRSRFYGSKIDKQILKWRRFLK